MKRSSQKVDNIKVIDSHTHFKEKFLKVLLKKDIKKYLDSHVECAVGVVDYFLVDWKTVIKEAAELLSCYIYDKNKIFFEQRVIENLLWEEVDFCKGDIDIKGFSKKLQRKLFYSENLRKFIPRNDLYRILNFILPFDRAYRFIKNVKEEIIASRKIHRDYGINTCLCAGIHPLAIDCIGDLKEVKKVLSELKKLIMNNVHIIGIGECGIENNTKVEKDVFYEMLLLAKDLNVLVVIHTPLTYGDIPSDGKLKGIKDICRIAKKSEIDTNLLTFDHITDFECIKILKKEFPKNKPYISFSMQDHWITPKETAELIKTAGSDWHERIMVNSDFGTYQTPAAFSLLKKHLNKLGIDRKIIEKVCRKNALRFFNIEDKNSRNITKKSRLIIDLTQINETLDLLFVFKNIKDWILPVYNFKEFVILSKNKEMLNNYASLIDVKNVKTKDGHHGKRKSDILLTILPNTDFSNIYEQIRYD